MPDNKYISLENLARFKSKLEQKIDEKQDNLGVNVAIPQGTTADELSSLKINENYYDLTKANSLEIGSVLNFPVKLNRVFHIGKVDNDYLGITRTDEYSVTKELLAINKTAITSKTDLVVEKNLTVSQNITDGTNSISVADIVAKQDALVSGTNIKTVNGNSLLGSGDISISNSITYTAGSGINIDNNNEISVSGKQDTLISGTNIKTVDGKSVVGSGNIDIDSITYLSQAPDSPNTSGKLKFVLLDTEPNLKQPGYIYIIVEPEIVEAEE